MTRRSGPRGAAPVSSGSKSRPLTRSDELDIGHGRTVALARPELQDAQVAAGTVGVGGPDLLEELVGHLLVPDEGDHLALVVDAALHCLRDELLGDGPQRLGLRLGRLDRPRVGRHERGEEVPHHRLLVGGVPAEAPRLARGGRHQKPPGLSRRARPRSSSRTSTSSSDFWPKFVMASSSSGVRWISSPTVLLWARLRQLWGRSERSRSSIGRSRSGEPLVVLPASPSSRPWPSSASSATSESRPRRVWPADASASRGVIEPSVSMSRTRRS